MTNAIEVTVNYTVIGMSKEEAARQAKDYLNSISSDRVLGSSVGTHWTKGPDEGY